MPIIIGRIRWRRIGATGGVWMSTFVFSVLAGFLIHQLITIIQPKVHSGPTRFQTFTLGPRVVLRLPARTYLRVKAYALATLISLFVILLVFIITQATHPPRGYAYRLTDAITSPLIGSAFFGVLVGVLVGNLINRIFRSAKYELGSRDRFEIFLIVFLFILGLGGEELLRSYAKRVNKISFGATNEISFADTSVKSTRASAEQPGNAGEKAGSKAGEYLSTGGSNGLPKLRNLGSDIEQDREYTRLIYDYEKIVKPQTPQWQQKPKNVIERLTQTTISPIGGCLEAIFARNADAEFVDHTLSELSKDLRKLNSLQEFDQVETLITAQQVFGDVATSLGRMVVDIQNYARLVAARANQKPDLEANKRFFKYCVPVAMLACDQAADWPPSKDPSDWKSGDWNLNCTTSNAKQHIIQVINNINVSSTKTASPLEVDRSAFDGILDTPYTAIAYASVMAQLGYYEAAALILHEWLEAHQSAKNDLAMKWSVLRTRFALGVFVEEWIRSRGDSSGLALRQYHVDNLKSIITELSGLSAVADLDRLNNKYDLKIDFLGASHTGDEGSCNLPDKMAAILDNLDKPTDSRAKPGPEVLFNLFESYVSAQSTYVDNFLKHTLLKVRGATIVDSRMRQLAKLDLKCVIPENRPGLRAEILERYIRNEINLIENLSVFGNTDKTGAKILDAQRVVLLATQLLDRQQRDERAGKETEPSFLKKVSSSPTIELYETLLATKTRLQELADKNAAQ